MCSCKAVSPTCRTSQVGGAKHRNYDEPRLVNYRCDGLDEYSGTEIRRSGKGSWQTGDCTNRGCEPEAFAFSATGVRRQ